jgi:hypothetical protein
MENKDMNTPEQDSNIVGDVPPVASSKKKKVILGTFMGLIALTVSLTFYLWPSNKPVISDEEFDKIFANAFDLSDEELVEVKKGSAEMFGPMQQNTFIDSITLRDGVPVKIDLRLTMQKMTPQIIEQIRGKDTLEELYFPKRFDASCLTSPTTFPVLKRLWFSGSTNVDLALANLHGLEALEFINLFDTDITGDGLKELLVAKRLNTINLGNTEINDDSIEILGKMPQLRTVNLFGTKVSKKGKNRLNTLLQTHR